VRGPGGKNPGSAPRQSAPPSSTPQWSAVRRDRSSQDRWRAPEGARHTKHAPLRRSASSFEEGNGKGKKESSRGKIRREDEDAWLFDNLDRERDALRAEAEDELRRSEARFRSLTELSSDWYWTEDENMRFTYLSSQIEDLTGYSRDSFIGKTRWELENMTPMSTSWAEHRAVLQARRPFRDLKLRRIAQDCRRLYGGGIALADVELLDPENYSQIVRAVLGPPYGSNAQGAHTLNSTEGIEIIDLVGPVKRVRSVRQ